MSIQNNIWSAMQAAWLKRFKSSSYVDSIDSSIGNAFAFHARDAADLNDLPLIGYNSSNQLAVGGAIQTPAREQVRFHIFPNASNVSQTFFTNCTPDTLYITGISEVHTTLGSATPTLAITHETQLGGLLQAAGTGKSVMTGTFDQHATAATVQNATLGANYQTQTRNINVNNPSPGSGLIVLQPGDALSAKYAGAITALAGTTVTLYLVPGGRYKFVNYYVAPAGTAATASLMISLRPRTLLYGAAVWQVKEATAATLTLDITKDASATAPGAGTSMLASTVNLKGAALTYNQLALSATAANLLTGPTDSVALKISASNTELAGLCVTLAFDGKQNEVSLHHNSVNSTAGTNEEFWIADRDYQIMDFAAKWSTVSTSNTAGLTIDTGTQTPATGQVVQTDNSNAGFLTSGTVNVPVFATLSAVNTRFLRRGDRLGIKNAGTLGTLAGLQISVRLRPE